MTPAETMAFILTHRPGATSGTFYNTPEPFTQVFWSSQDSDGVQIVRTMRVRPCEPVKTQIRHVYPLKNGPTTLDACTWLETPLGDDVGAAILQALDRLFMETTE